MLLPVLGHSTHGLRANRDSDRCRVLVLPDMRALVCDVVVY